MRRTAVRRLCFSAGHRLVGHEGGCRHLHGHNYVVYVHAAAEQLDDVGRVLDFAVLKERVGGWINEHWDHAMLLWEADPLGALWGVDGAPLVEHKVFMLTANPTAEELAAYLLLEVCPNVLADTGVTVTRVEVQETENCSAVASLEVS